MRARFVPHVKRQLDSSTHREKPKKKLFSFFLEFDSPYVTNYDDCGVTNILSFEIFEICVQSLERTKGKSQVSVKHAEEEKISYVKFAEVFIIDSA